MFFDEPKVDTQYQQLLLAIAHKQRELLQHRFDWQSRSCKLWPPKGLFGKDKTAIAAYEATLRELEQLKAQTVAHRKQQGYTPGTFWWNIPWEQLENYLICDLQQTQEDGPWRFARKWNLERKDDVYILILDEEGHCSNFTGEYSYQYEELSKYSASERNQMARDYNRRLDNYELSQIMFDNDRPVRSTYGNVYASMSDYVMSTDHYLHRDYLDWSYRRSLYTEHHTNTLTVHSNSIHYECVMAVGCFHKRFDGVVDGIQLLDFEVLGSRGQVPPMLEEEYLQKDAAVALAAYIADSAEFSTVPVQLFGKNILDSASSYAEAMRQAEMYTCLAHKLKFID